jgi:hypothetical protein
MSANNQIETHTSSAYILRGALTQATTSVLCLVGGRSLSVGACERRTFAHPTFAQKIHSLREASFPLLARIHSLPKFHKDFVTAHKTLQLISDYSGSFRLFPQQCDVFYPACRVPVLFNQLVFLVFSLL